ncbi:MAG: hypothetical protein KJ890_06165 [Gammaproteobacteria bacterium]|nr:hypothetical protein [Gammaproteobacteria bacterium]MBU1804145.1 hypothetical protein [Gammaproteobacteria bacterium]
MDIQKMAAGLSLKIQEKVITTLEALGKDASSFAPIYLDSMNRDKAKKFLESGAPATTSPSWATAKFSK